jgi:hypothetical protein
MIGLRFDRKFERTFLETAGHCLVTIIQFMAPGVVKTWKNGTTALAAEPPE